MLSRLRLRNFKSWEDTGDIALRPITAFFGANSSGKTSLLQALLLLKQTSTSSDPAEVFHFGGAETPADLGDFQNILHHHDPSRRVEISLDWTTDSPVAIRDWKRREIARSSSLGYTVKAEYAGTGPRRIAVEEMSYRVGEGRFGMRRNSKGHTLFGEGSDYRFVRRKGRPWPLPPPVRCYGFPDEVGAYYRNAGFLAGRSHDFAKLLGRIQYLGPLRSYPERCYYWTGVEPADMGRAGEAAVAAILASRDRGRNIPRGRGRRRHTLEEHVASWLRDLGLIHDFSVEPLKEGLQVFQVVARKTAGSAPVPITDIGFGVSQTLPVLVLCFYAAEGSTIILEQPEIHLHPKIQAGLADVLIAAVRHRRVQILVESHSEYLLRRLVRRVADETLSSDRVGLWSCESGEMSSTITALEMDTYGVIANWPDEFFADDFEEIAETAMLQLRRRAKAERARRRGHAAG